MPVSWTSLFRRFLRVSVKSSARRSLVPDRLSGSKAISVHYRVEDISRSNILQVLTRCVLKMMTVSDSASGTPITPPVAVRGMKILDRDLFSRIVTIPAIKVPARHILDLTKKLRVSLLKMIRIKPVAELSKDDPLYHTHKLFLLDPTKFRTAENFCEEERMTLRKFGVSVEELYNYDLKVGYENWGVPDVLRAVLPLSSGSVSGFSIIGHIAHLNLKRDVLDYKHLIGQVILDKTSGVRTVVNKVTTIDNTFRNFQMELLAGEDNLVTCARENGCVFEMDFSKVYWNPRLSTEHKRVVSMLKRGSVLYDVFAGVGPFAIPAARRGVTVLANDLNQHSYSALCANIKLNKVKDGLLHAYNMDGREFILTVVKPDLSARLRALAGVCDNAVAPTASAAAPTTSAAAPTASDAGPTASDAAPTASDAAPTASDSAPTVSDAAPTTSAAELIAIQANPVAETVGAANPAVQYTEKDSSSKNAATTEGDNDSNEMLTKPEGENDGSAQVPSTEEQQQEAASPCHKERHYSASPSLVSSNALEMYVTMNLPALALEFLDAFCGLLADLPEEVRGHPRVARALPTVICYCFEHRKHAEGDVKSRVEAVLGCMLPDAFVRCVRNVAPGKDMMCVKFRLMPEIVFGRKRREADDCSDDRQDEEDQPPSKRKKTAHAV